VKPKSTYGVRNECTILNDFELGQTFGSGHLLVDADAIKRFAAEFDPQPFHLDEQAARDSMFRGLAASGWHTTALTMRLLVDSEFKPAGGVIGASFDELRWPQPVRPGDELRVETEVLEVKTGIGIYQGQGNHPESGRRSSPDLHWQPRGITSVAGVMKYLSR
jgi:acyl dehydratase